MEGSEMPRQLNGSAPFAGIKEAMSVSLVATFVLGSALVGEPAWAHPHAHLTGPGIPRSVSSPTMVPGLTPDARVAASAFYLAYLRSASSKQRATCNSWRSRRGYTIGKFASALAQDLGIGYWDAKSGARYGLRRACN